MNVNPVKLQLSVSDVLALLNSQFLAYYNSLNGEKTMQLAIFHQLALHNIQKYMDDETRSATLKCDTWLVGKYLLGGEEEAYLEKAGYDYVINRIFGHVVGFGSSQLHLKKDDILANVKGKKIGYVLVPTTKLTIKQ